MKLLQWLQVELQSKLILRQRIAISIAIFITFHKVQPIPSQCLAEAKGWATFELRWVSPRYTSHPGHSTLRDPKGHSLMSPSFPTPLTWPTGFWISSLTHVVNQRKLIEGLYMRPEGIYWYLAQTTHYCALACSDHWISDHFAINAKIRLEKTKSSTKGNIL